ncbi:haloacid dehalogenase, type II [Exophiala spinifera]|uniref:Haloacid dehalogenase, type II n=1 Tax=Exophiala spinifera TaxID=91928 RepID=A0A0D1YKX0_9EURO|nr:haloacid dehalogenase, type II [Exophiala spinifera]KIW15671.1 haloacid dehalogenase, type II [Exophiala spinifera]
MAHPTEKKHVVFDIEGTVVSHHRVFQALEERLGPALQDAGIKPSLLGYTWFEVAEREYTYCGMSGNYVPFTKVFRAVFFRILWMAGITKPREFASEADLDFLMDAYASLEPRPGAKQCIQHLRDSGYTVWAFTAGDPKQVHGYFVKAGIDMDVDHVLASDTYGVPKPALEPYRALLSNELAGADEVWFAAAHMWDVSAARRAGFRGAFCTVFENEPLYDIFGDMDVVEDTLEEMARAITAH